MKTIHLFTSGKTAFKDNNILRENVLIRLSSLPSFYISTSLFSSYVKEELEYSSYVNDSISNIKTISERI